MKKIIINKHISRVLRSLLTSYLIAFLLFGFLHALEVNSQNQVVRFEKSIQHQTIVHTCPICFFHKTNKVYFSPTSPLDLTLVNVNELKETLSFSYVNFIASSIRQRAPPLSPFFS